MAGSTGVMTKFGYLAWCLAFAGKNMCAVSDGETTKGFCPR